MTVIGRALEAVNTAEDGVLDLLDTDERLAEYGEAVHALREAVVGLQRDHQGAVAENERLREALRNFGAHAESCPRYRLFAECDCGLDAAIGGAVAPPG